ncbi:hypothetical protein BKA82DRAFT_1007976 [Pisolithus tinctorius]|uniref:Uncharacterized protein n=1 Tax=Pisolithus tinctorius Marx 270 TaxID=870435 RepID=A0A0C3N1K3_PISTI|nr:hypothetical protein BKA82DRAFT_1007976 [Pisolithus tinctorius]KIN94954.1 hypothetical protein M404DRAFT_1007976 [Pisolithus tinctorius Marx 270]KIN99287.1 hypothetical protein M404DRAFT_1004779 [Pisolithus tinctorius Marx 270]
MSPQPRFSSSVPPTPVEKYDASACYLHYDLKDSDCFSPDAGLLGKRTNSSPPGIHYNFPEVKRPSTFIFGTACVRFFTIFQQSPASDAPAISG